MTKKNGISIITVVFLILSLSLLLTQNISHAEEERFGVIGISVAQIFDPAIENKMGPLVVLDVKDGTPASVHGIQRGDIISHIDGETTKGNKWEYLIFEKLRGKSGSKVKFLIERPGARTPVEVILTRK